MISRRERVEEQRTYDAGESVSLAGVEETLRQIAEAGWRKFSLAVDTCLNPAGTIYAAHIVGGNDQVSGYDVKMRVHPLPGGEIDRCFIREMPHGTWFDVGCEVPSPRMAWIICHTMRPKKKGA